MREILFRGKRFNGEWFFGSLLKVTFDGTTYNLIFADNFFFVFGQATAMEHAAAIPETVGQYTGLTDKNGKKIFEGDIVVCKNPISGNWIDYCVEIGFVEMKHGAFGLHRKQGYYRPFKDWLEDYEYEVIGNIHDNPELIGGNDNA